MVGGSDEHRRALSGVVFDSQPVDGLFASRVRALSSKPSFQSATFTALMLAALGDVPMTANRDPAHRMRNATRRVAVQPRLRLQAPMPTR